MNYEYKTVPFAPVVQGLRKQNLAEAAAKHLATVLRREAVDGFEFFRVDTLDVLEPSGCLVPANPKTIRLYVATFRRSADEAAERLG